MNNNINMSSNNKHDKLNNNSSNNESTNNDFYKFPILVRIAVYDNFTSIPRIIDLEHNNINDFINITTEKIYQISHEQGGKIPYTIIKEIVENLIHAQFTEVVITIVNNGNQIIISDQGPGIADKEKAMLPGFTSATKEMKKFIRGVGSGLPIVKETIRFSGGSIDIKDNINNGTVVILKINNNSTTIENPSNSTNIINVNENMLNNTKIKDSTQLNTNLNANKNITDNDRDINNINIIDENSLLKINNIEDEIYNIKNKNLSKINNLNNQLRDSVRLNFNNNFNDNQFQDSTKQKSNLNNPNNLNLNKNTEIFENNFIPEEFRSINLTLRQIKILFLILELEEVGPSLISKELGFSPSTSFRELSNLEKQGLVKTFSSGKKRLTKKGFKYLEYYSNNF